MKSWLLTVALCALLVLHPTLASAQTYPERPLTYVVPYPAGGTADVFARQLAQKLGERLGRPVVVENRAGANGNIDSDHVAKRGGRRLHPAAWFSQHHHHQPALYGRNMPYDPLKDLQAVSGTHAMANVLVVNNAMSCQSVADVIAAAKQKPGALAYASVGAGNTMHPAGEQFKMQAGIDLLHVPNKGGPPNLIESMNTPKEESRCAAFLFV